MIEVLLVGDGWTWTMLCPAGRIIVYTTARYATDGQANDAAKAYRAAFWAIADQIDHRQARCI